MSPNLKQALAALLVHSPFYFDGIERKQCIACTPDIGEIINDAHEDDCLWLAAKNAFELECLNLEQRLIERLNTKECALEDDAISGMDITDFANWKPAAKGEK